MFYKKLSGRMEHLCPVIIKKQNKDAVDQGSANYSTRVKSAPQSHSIRPAKAFHPAAQTFCQ